ncbi:hypothetical protein L6452_04434 [Arctium lappa]|uniref:Uncharacterized protein n=1 Tax=Arctium lappa TaxID=4217 RepID=A0ACB9EDK1_ARCLA|nr:hypothetical protein L6452_04434 [Arctium lappa]
MDSWTANMCTNANGVDKDGFQTVTRKSSGKTHASSLNGQMEQQKKENHPVAESGKSANDKKKSKSKVASHKDYRQAVSFSFNRFSVLSDPSLPKDLGSSSFPSPIHQASSEPMDTSFEQDDLLEVEDVIEVDSDDGVTARFLTSDPMPSQVDPMPTPEPEQMDSIPSLVF